MKQGRSLEQMAVNCYGDVEPAKFARFVELKPFAREWNKLGLTEDDRKALQVLIMADPNRRTIPGTGGLVKLRFSSDRWDRGKSRGARVCYAYFAEFSTVLLVTIYFKGDKDDLTEKEKRQIKQLLNEINEMLKKGQINV